MDFTSSYAESVPGREPLPEWVEVPELRLPGDAERVLVDDHRTSSSKTHTAADGTVLSRTDTATQTTRLLLLPGWAGRPALHLCLNDAPAACLITITWPRPPAPAGGPLGRAVEASVAGTVGTARAVRAPSGWDDALVLDASLPRLVPGQTAESVDVRLEIALRGTAVPKRPVMDLVAMDAYLNGRERMIRAFEE